DQNKLQVLINGGAAVFGEPTAYPTGSTPRSVSAGDLDGDGFVDLVVANSNGNTITVYHNKGNGTFQATGEYGINWANPYRVLLTDITGDGKLDAVLSAYGSSVVVTMEGNGNGTFGPPIGYGVGGNPFQ